MFTRVDDAVMLMFEWKDEPATISNILRAAGHHKQRIHFAKLPPVDQRFASKGLAHVFLDTPLYNAHGTATEVISAGVPVVSYASNTSPHFFSYIPKTFAATSPLVLSRRWRSCQPRRCERAARRRYLPLPPALKAFFSIDLMWSSGTPQTIARNMEDYVDIVCRLAENGGSRAQALRAQLLRTRSCSCLGVAAVWAAKVSAAMRSASAFLSTFL